MNKNHFKGFSEVFGPIMLFLSLSICKFAQTRGLACCCIKVCRGQAVPIKVTSESIWGRSMVNGDDDEEEEEESNNNHGDDHTDDADPKSMNVASKFQGEEVECLTGQIYYYRRSEKRSTTRSLVPMAKGPPPSPPLIHCCVPSFSSCKLRVRQ